MPADPATLRGLVAVARLALAETERVGLLVDDLPELVVACAERWLAGDRARAEADARVLHEAVYSPRPGADASRGPEGLPTRALHVIACDLAGYVGDVRAGGRRGAVAPNDLHREAVIQGACICLVRLGEPLRAATERVFATFAAAGEVAPGEPV